MVDPQGNFTDLYNLQGFGEGTDGNGPTGIVFGPDGDFYGSMLIGGFGDSQLCDPNGCGTVFRLSLR
jgi:hypothetical protein